MDFYIITESDNCNINNLMNLELYAKFFLAKRRLKELLREKRDNLEKKHEMEKAKEYNFLFFQSIRLSEQNLKDRNYFGSFILWMRSVKINLKILKSFKV